MSIFPANAQQEPSDKTISRILQTQNSKLLFHTDAPIVVPPPAAAATSAGFGDGYATITYEIGSTSQRKNLEKWILWIANTLPASFGNTSGTYTITITIHDGLGKTLLAKEPILSVQWSTTRGFLFIDKTVSDLRSTSWQGTLISDMPVTQVNRAVRIGIEVYQQKDRSLDFSAIKQTAQAFSAGALAGLMPLPAAAGPIIDTVGNLLNSFYQNSTKTSLLEEQGHPLQAAKIPLAVMFDVPNEDPFPLPVNVTIDTRKSRLINGDLPGGRFEKDSLTEAIFANTSILIVDKPVSIVELISSSTEPRFKSTRTLLDSLAAGQDYGLDPNNRKEANGGLLCSNLYDALNSYLSPYDARAMFWAFVTKYQKQMKKDDCLGTRKSELAAVGLSVDN